MANLPKALFSDCCPHCDNGSFVELLADLYEQGKVSVDEPFVVFCEKCGEVPVEITSELFGTA